jgi:hypothetical protein
MARQKPKTRPHPGSVPRKEAPQPALPGADTSGDRMCWRFTHADHDGPWCFHEVGSEELCGVLEQLGSFESMTVREAFSGSPGKDYNIEGIPNKDAQKRLDAIGLPDQTQISRLRLGGTQRLYGFRQGNVFHIVWWDPRHEIWPSRKRNT